VSKAQERNTVKECIALGNTTEAQERLTADLNKQRNAKKLFQNSLSVLVKK
jgi:transposase